MQARPFMTRPNDDVIVTSFVIRRCAVIGDKVIHTSTLKYHGVVYEQLD